MSSVFLPILNFSINSLTNAPMYTPGKEAIDAVKKEFDISDEEMQKYVDESLEKKGGYDERLYLSWSSDTEYSSHDHGQGLDD